MKRRTMLSGATVALMTLGGAAAADSGHGHGDPGARGSGAGNNDMRPMMMRKHSGMMGGGMGMMQGVMPGMGSMGSAGGMMGARLMPMMEALDVDGDSIVTPEEAREGLQALLSEYDANGDSSLSLAEFETLHSALIREFMVDRFQFLDDDGDGQVTAGEVVKPADQMERMQSMRKRAMQGGGNMSRAGPKGEHGRGMMDDN